MKGKLRLAGDSIQIDFSRSTFERALCQDSEGRLTWDERDVSRSFITLILTIVWPWWMDVPDRYGDIIMGTMASQITSLIIVYSTVYSGADQRKHQSSASLAFVQGIHRGPVNSPHKWPLTRKMFPFDDVIMSDWGDFKWRAVDTSSLYCHGSHFA